MGTRDDYVTEDEVLEAARRIRKYAMDNGVSCESVLSAALRINMVQMYGSQKTILDFVTEPKD